MSAEQRREQLLSVTTPLIVECGFQGVSIETISQRAGITRAVVYQHFGNLQALFEAVVERETSRALAQVSETTLENLSDGDPRELMLESLHAYLCAVRDHPTTWRFVLMPPIGAPAVLRNRIDEGRATVLAQMARAVQPLLAAEGEASDAELTAHVLSAISDEYARLVLTDPDRFPPERLVSHARWWLAQPAFQR